MGVPRGDAASSDGAFAGYFVENLHEDLGLTVQHGFAHFGDPYAETQDVTRGVSMVQPGLEDVFFGGMHGEEGKPAVSGSTSGAVFKEGDYPQALPRDPDFEFAPTTVHISGCYE